MAKQQGSSFSGFDSPTALRLPAWYRWGVIVIGVSFVFFCAWFLHHSYGHLLDGLKARLSAMADDRQIAIQTWVGERWSDAKTVASYPAIGELLELPSPGATGRSDEDLLTHLRPLLDQRVSVYHYLGISVIDSEGAVRAHSSGALPLDPDCFAAMRTARPGSPSLLVNLHRHASGQPAISFSEPVFGASGKGPLLGAVVVEVDPATWLYPALRREPTPTNTGECFIAERRGNRLLFLSSLRHRPDPPCTLSIPFENVCPAVCAALQGTSEYGRFWDYRDEEVWLATRLIQGTPWALVTKIDQSEILRPFYLQTAVTLSLLISLLALLVTGTAVLLRSMRTRHLSTLMRQGDRYRVLKDHAHEMMFFAASDGRLLEANLAAQETLGYSEAEFRGMSLRDLRAPDAQSRVEEEMLAATLPGGAVFESLFRRKDGSLLPVRINSCLVQTEGLSLRFSVVQNITAEKENLQRILRLDRLYRTLSEVNQLIVRAQGRQQLLEETCAILVSVAGFSMVWVGFKDEATGRVLPEASAGDATGYLETLVVRWDDTPEAKGPTGTGLRENRPIVFADCLNDPAFGPWREKALRAGFQTCGAFPINLGGDPQGTLNIYSRERGAIGEEESTLLCELANDLGYALEALEERQRRKEAMQALWRTNELLALTSEIAQVGGWEFDTATGKGSWTAEVAKIHDLPTDLEPTAALGLSFYSGESLSKIEAALQRATEAAEPYNLELEMVSATGKQKWVRTVGVPVIEDGRVVRMRGIFQDITARKLAELALVASEEKYHLLADHTYDWESWIGEDGRFRYVSPSCERFSGYPPQLFYDNPDLILSIVHPLDRPRLERHYLVDLHDPAPCDQLDFRILTRSGAEVWISHSCQAVYGNDGAFLGRRATDRDITPRKLAEERLRESEEVFRSFFEANLVASYLSTSEGQILHCNSAFLELFGLGSQEEAQAVSILDLFASRESLAAFLSSMEAGVPMRFVETGRRRKDGRFLTVLESASFLKDQTGKIRGFLGFMLDMTEQRRLDNDRRLLAAALEQAHDAVVVLDPRARILYMNPAFEELIGRDHAEILKAPISRYMAPAGREVRRNIRAALRSGHPWLGQITVPRKDHPPIILEAHFSSLPRRSAPALALGILRDVTEAEHLKQELSKVQRLETFGRIASGVAHEVRNPLFAISTVVAALDRKAGGDPQLKPFMGYINDHVSRLSRLMDDLLSIGRPLDSARFTRCDLAAVLNGTLDNIEAATPGSRGRFHLDLPDEPCTVMGDPSRLSQAFLNILSNALSFALPENPIEVALAHFGEHYSIVVSNRGPTIPEALMPVLFDPFVTARKGGTGLGLAIVRQILAAHQATITAENHPDGGGVSFQATFPVARRSEG